MDGRGLLHQPLHAASSEVYFEHSPCVSCMHPANSKVHHVAPEHFAKVGTMSPGMADDITPYAPLVGRWPPVTRLAFIAP